MSLPPATAPERFAPVQTPGAGPGITAAICTRDRPRMLERSIASLLAQSEPPEEIVVVDNAPSSDAARQLVAERFSKARYRLEPRPGLDVARKSSTACSTKGSINDLRRCLPKSRPAPWPKMSAKVR